MMMIEKVAQAIIDIRIAQDLQRLPPSLEQEARAAIAAMRDPTEEMIRANPPSNYWDNIIPTAEMQRTRLDNHLYGWRAMIDAALKEQP